MFKRLRLRGFAAHCALLGLTLPFLLAVRAPVPGDSRPEEIGRPQPAATVLQNGIAYEAGTKIARSLYRPNYAVAHADPETMARQFLRDHAELLKLEDAAQADLDNYFTRESAAATTVRFHQTHQGLPVLGNDLAVTIDQSDRVIFAVNGYETKINLPSILPALLETDARQIAIDYLGVTGPLAFDQTTLAVLPDGEQSTLVYQVKLVPGTEPHGDWEVLVDAHSGEIVRVIDISVYLDGSGLTWDPDPLSSAGVSYGGSYSDNNDATNAALDAERVSITLRDITDIGGGMYKLAGPYAVIVDSESPYRGLFTQGSTAFNYNRFDNAFEAVLCYYHIDHIMRYLNETLNVRVAPIQYAGGGDVAFGEGGVDDAEDADVVIHELGHAIHDWVTGGNLSQVNGLSEGTGDFVAQSYSRSLDQWTTSDPQYHWVFNWDGHNPFWPGRITNYGARYPGGLVGQIHTDGQIWSTCLMGIWDQIGRDQIDRAVWEGLAMTNSSSSQNDAAQAVMNAASALGYPSADITAIFNGFTSTGYTITAPFASLVAEDPVFTSAGGNNAADPGETVSFKLDITNIGSQSATDVSAVLSSSTPGVVVVQGSSDYPDLAPSGTESNNTDYTITIPAGHNCGDLVDLSLLINYDDGTPNSTTADASMQTGVPVGINLSASPGLAIPDNNTSGVWNTITVSGTGATVTSNLSIDINITHTYIGDLFVRLLSPGGTQVILHYYTGGSSDNIVGNYPITLTPAQSLSAMIGDPLDGNWTMIISDNASGDAGMFNSWGINDATSYDCDNITTDIAQGESLPIRFALDAARPNPFRPSTTIRFAVPGHGAEMALEIFDVAGRHVRTLVDGFRSPGEHAVTWNGVSENGRRAAAGIYFYRLQGAGFVETRKVVLVK